MWQEISTRLTLFPSYDNVWVSLVVSTFSVSLGDITYYNDEESLNGVSVV